MDEFTLSEVCYKNGFKDGQSAPIYLLISKYGICIAASHNKENLEALIVADCFIDDMLELEKIEPDVLDKVSIERVYNWNYRQHRYEI